MEKTSWPGNWKVVCDVCGFWFPSEKVKKRWDGLIVCEDDWEPRHPQDFIRGVEDDPTPAFVRSEPEENFLLVCNIVSSSGYAGLAEAGCAQAGNTTYSYSFLADINAGF